MDRVAAPDAASSHGAVDTSFANSGMDLETLRRSVQDDQNRNVPPAPTAQLLRVPEVMDDFVRNFLQRHGMQATLQCFESEWYRHTAARGVSPASPMVPDNYRETMALLNRIELLERDLRQHAELTTRVTQQWTQAKKDREYHRTNHQRVVQENARLTRLLKQAGQHAEQVNPTLTESRLRCEQLLKAKSLLTIERDKLKRDNEALEARVAELEGQQGGSSHPAVKPKPPARQRGADNASSVQGKRRGPSGPAARRGAPSSSSTAAATHAADGVDGGFSWPADERPHLAAPSSVGAATATTTTAATAAATTTAANGSGGVGGASASSSSAAAAARLSPPTASPATEWAEQASFQAHAMPVSCVALHPFKPVVASGCDDGTWRLSALPGGDAIVSGRGHGSWIASVALHPRGTMLATAAGDKTVKLWDFASSRCCATLTGHTEGVWDVEFQDTGVLLASAGLDKTARVWDAEAGLCRQTLRGHQDAVNAARWLPCTNLLLTGSADKTVAIWDARQNTRAQSFTGHRGAVQAVAVGPIDRGFFASCDTQGAVILWDARRMAQLLRVECGPQPANSVAIDGTGHFVAVASDDGSIKMIDVEETVVTELVGHDGPVQSVAFEVGNSRFLVSGGSDRTVRYWS
ncbi:WD domain G-beta repeat [Lotmaria passim]